MKTILYNKKYYTLINWHFTHIEAKDEMGNILLVKHNRHKNKLLLKIKVFIKQIIQKLLKLIK